MVRAIVVDDEKDMADSIAQTLEIEGIQVVGKGYDGEQAFQLFEQLKPDVVLLDMKMPNFDGAYAVEKITSKYPDAKIIVVTAYMKYVFPVNKVKAIFSKPYDTEELVAKIRAIT
jgi:DNA-binding response OmpR family regulator